MHRVAALVLLVAASLFLGGAHDAHAASTGLSIQPIKVSETIQPGSSASGSILLTNASDEDIQVEATVQDFIPDAGTDSIKFIGRAPGVTTVRDWITIGGNQTFIFKKGESRSIPYTITAPANAEPGSHFGVAFFKATRLEDAQAGIKVGTQVGMLIFVTVPGDFKQQGSIEHFAAPSFVEGSPVDFTMNFENTGTVHFEPKGTITITNMFGSVVGEVPIEGQVVLPTGVRALKFRWMTSDILMGLYTATATVNDGSGNPMTTATATFWAFPLWYLFWFVLTVAVLFFIFRFIKKRVRVSVNLQ